jgi:hypothetical protein
MAIRWIFIRLAVTNPRAEEQGLQRIYNFVLWNARIPSYCRVAGKPR